MMRSARSVLPSVRRADLLGEAVYWLAQLPEADIEEVNRSLASYAREIGLPDRPEKLRIYSPGDSPGPTTRRP